MVDDCRSSMTGGLMTGLEIWRLAVLPYLLNNSECWVEIDKKSILTLSGLQTIFFTPCSLVGADALFLPATGTQPA